MTKKFWRSKTFWVMALTLVTSVVTGITGETWLDGDMQLAILSFIGLVLRMVTNQGLEK